MRGIGMALASFTKALLTTTLLFSASLITAAPGLTATEPEEKNIAANAWLEIDTDALTHNIRTLRKQVADTSTVCAVLKADAYGHGLSIALPVVIKEGITCIGVTSNQELRAVRAGGFTGRLMRLRTASPMEIDAAMQDDVEELAGNLPLAKKMADIAEGKKRILNVHLALNSAGMSRNGLELATTQGMDDALAIASLPSLKVAGIMTHFPVEDRADVVAGLKTFNAQAAQVVQKAGLDRKSLLLHAANSFSTLEVPESHLDAVRPGGALFGDVPQGHSEYRRVMQFKSRVAAVNHFPKGNTVGYNRTLTLKRDSLLANIPVGYSDGYSVSLSNKTHVLIRGHKVPVMGRASMNTIMVDVTDVAGIQPDDEVVLFGQQGDETITQQEIENAHGALLADLYTVWGNSNPKVVKKAPDSMQ
jgi:alanine racemase